ncbi:MAG TPA: valine--tRNA ligase, partial [Acidobacteriaceae bacterium]
EKAAVPLRLFVPVGDQALTDVWMSNLDVIERLGRVTDVRFASESLQGAGTRTTPGVDVQVIYEKQVDVAAECERLVKDLVRLEKEQANAQRQLGNESFLAKAPAPVVEGIRRRAGELDDLLIKTRATLDRFGCMSKA